MSTQGHRNTRLMVLRPWESCGSGLQRCWMAIRECTKLHGTWWSSRGTIGAQKGTASHFWCWNEVLMQGWFSWQPVDPAPLGPADQLCDSSTGQEYNHPVHLSQEGDRMQPFLLQANDGKCAQMEHQYQAFSPSRWNINTKLFHLAVPWQVSVSFKNNNTSNVHAVSP